MAYVRRIDTVDIINLITDYRHEYGREAWHIRLHMSGGEILLYARLTRFASYRRVLKELQAARKEARSLMVHGQ
jgi:hypothetical protein